MVASPHTTCATAPPPFRSWLSPETVFGEALFCFLKRFLASWEKTWKLIWRSIRFFLRHEQVYLSACLRLFKTAPFSKMCLVALRICHMSVSVISMSLSRGYVAISEAFLESRRSRKATMYCWKFMYTGRRSARTLGSNSSSQGLKSRYRSS